MRLLFSSRSGSRSKTWLLPSTYTSKRKRHILVCGLTIESGLTGMKVLGRHPLAALVSIIVLSAMVGLFCGEFFYQRLARTYVGTGVRLDIEDTEFWYSLAA